ncbi:MAG: peroxide stress protein YaaA [Gammaproteobacteria bacterium CG22_combo_CG10-13_8_21_14_all_40_8]|nr:MAG: peroxide stress protein YaaA [Gammaproteobacteria bacterium CG22_combo_CG10-13_8_21_14_all_40_8]
MQMLISPAKSLDFDSKSPVETESYPEYLDYSQQLIDIAKALSPLELSKLMGISDKLAALNAARFQHWQQPFTSSNAKQAIFTFTGDVYVGLDVETLNVKQLDYLQQQLKILSGLYGLLKPLDLMQPYRLEMGTKLKNSQGDNLYAFWRSMLTDKINQVLSKQKNPYLINLASKEYFSAINYKKINGKIITPVFKDWKNGQYKIISFFAKKARGLMVRYAALHQVSEPQQLQQFNLEGYVFNKEQSTETEWLFTRKQD